MSNRDGGIGLFGIVAGRGIDVCRDGEAVQLVSYGMYIHSAFHVAGDGPAVNQSERIGLGPVIKVKGLVGIGGQGGSRNQAGGDRSQSFSLVHSIFL